MSNLELPTGELQRRLGLKRWAEAWIQDEIEPDANLGRSDASFLVLPAVQVRPFQKSLQARGIKVYSGSGNFFLVDVSGKTPRLLQRRPLAQRFVELVEDR